MAMINDLDLGWLVHNQKSHAGQSVSNVAISGHRNLAYSGGGELYELDCSILVTAPQPVAGYLPPTQPGGDIRATRLLVQQLEQLANSKSLQPVYFQPEQSVAHPAPRATEYDGWYYIKRCEVSRKSMAAGYIEVNLTLVKVNMGWPTAVPWRSGPIQPSGFTLAAVDLLPLSFNCQGVISGQRSGAEGPLPYAINPTTTPYPIRVSNNPADWFRGACRVWDMMGPASNGTYAVPTSGYSNPNWLELKGIEHAMQGDLCISNGFMMLTFTTGGPVCQIYSWNALTNSWVVGPQLQYRDNNGTTGALQSIRFERHRWHQAEVWVNVSTPVSSAEIQIVLPTGQRHFRVGFRPWTATVTRPDCLYLLIPGNTAQSELIFSMLGNPFNGSGTFREARAGSGYVSVASSTFPFVAALTAQTAPMIYGWLYTNIPYLPNTSVATYNGSELFVGEQGQVAGTRYFYGVGAAYSGGLAAQVMGSAAAGTVAAPWTVAPDAAAIGGSAVQWASGTAGGGGLVTITTPWALPPGNYMALLRLRTATAGTGTTAELQWGMWNGTGFVGGGSQTIAPTAASTTYYLAALGPVSITASTSVQIVAMATSGVTSTVSWLVDEAFIFPVTGGNEGIGDVSVQALQDRVIDPRFV